MMNPSLDTEPCETSTSELKSNSATSSMPAVDVASAVDTEPTRPRQNLYQVVWRWHFYAGLFVAPIFFVVTLTGVLYVFRTELTFLRDRSLLFVTPQSKRLSYEELHQIAVAYASPHEVEAITVHPEANRSVRFVAHIEAEAKSPDSRPARERYLYVYVDPYTGKVLGSQIAEEDFFAIVLQLHRNLFMGTPGRIVTELTTSWGLLLLATGAFLWWPRGKKNVGVWAPKLRGKLYATLRDLHAVTGFYLVPLAFLLIGTGMFFTVLWGANFNKVVKKAGHWPEAWFAKPKSEPAPPGATPVSLDQVVTNFLTYSRPYDSVGIKLAASPDAAHQAWMIQDENKNSYRMVAIDQYTGEILRKLDANEVPLLYRVRLWTVSIHMGQIFGLPTKILSLITSLGLLGLTITGLWMWWRRRPAGRAGFPRRPPPGSLPTWGWAIIVACGLILPIVGASMVLVCIADTCLQKIGVAFRGSREEIAP